MKSSSNSLRFQKTVTKIITFFVVSSCLPISSAVTEGESPEFNLGGSDGGNGGIIGNGSSPEFPISSENINISSTEKPTSSVDVIAKWIGEASSPPPPPTPPRSRARSTKVLETPLQSQLISQFHEPTDLETIPPTSTEIPFSTPKKNLSEKRRRLLHRNHPSAFPSKPTIKRRQDTYEIASSIDGLLPPQSPPEIEFTSIVSPLEGSLGGFTGLQGLPPLSPVQFVKLLVSVTPFIIPLIFIPLLIFTIGLLMIPVTRQNIFLDVGDLRTSSTSFLSNYVVTPITRLGGALPRSLAYNLVDTEECVERISCEISARYLHSTWEPGNWRSIPNTSWISRILGYFWKRNPTVSRIAKSLEAMEMTKERRGHLPQEDGENSVIRRSSGLSLSKERRSGGGGACSRYTCQPKTLLHKFLSPSNSQSSS